MTGSTSYSKTLLRTFTGGQSTKLSSHLLNTPDNATGTQVTNVDITKGTLASAKGLTPAGNATGSAVCWFKNYFSFMPQGTLFTDLLNMKVALKPDGLLYNTLDGKVWKPLQVTSQPKSAKVELVEGEALKEKMEAANTVEKSKNVSSWRWKRHHRSVLGSCSWSANRWSHDYSLYAQFNATFIDFQITYERTDSIQTFTFPKNLLDLVTIAPYNATCTAPDGDGGADDFNVKDKVRIPQFIGDASVGVTLAHGGVLDEARFQNGCILVPVLYSVEASKEDLQGKGIMQIVTPQIAPTLKIKATLAGKEVYTETASLNTTMRWERHVFQTKEGELVVEVAPEEDTKLSVLALPPKEGIQQYRLAILNVSDKMLYGAKDTTLIQKAKIDSKSQLYDFYEYPNSLPKLCGNHCRFLVYDRTATGQIQELELPTTKQDRELLYRSIVHEVPSITTANAVNPEAAIETNIWTISAVSLGKITKFPSIKKTTMFPTVGGLYGKYSYVVTLYNEKADFETGPSEISGPFEVGIIMDGKQYTGELRLGVTVPDLTFQSDELTVRIYRLGGAVTKFRLLKEIPMKEFKENLSDDGRYIFTDNIQNKDLGAELITRDNVDVSGLSSITNYYGQLFAAKGNMVIWSKENRPEYWDAKSYMTFDSDVVAVAATQEGVLVLTNLRTYILAGQFDAMYKMVLSENTGCLHKGSVATGGNTTMWQSEQGLVLYSSGQIQQVTFPKLEAELPLIVNSFFAEGKYYGVTANGQLLVIDGNNNLAVLWYNYSYNLLSGCGVAHKPYFTDGKQLLDIEGPRIPMTWRSQKLATFLNSVKNFKGFYIFCASAASLSCSIYVDGKLANTVALKMGKNQIYINQQYRLGYYIELVFTGVGEVLEVQYIDEENQDAR